jgi:hypothetical protein
MDAIFLSPETVCGIYWWTSQPYYLSPLASNLVSGPEYTTAGEQPASAIVSVYAVTGAPFASNGGCQRSLRLVLVFPPIVGDAGGAGGEGSVANVDGSPERGVGWCGGSTTVACRV